MITLSPINLRNNFSFHVYIMQHSYYYIYYSIHFHFLLLLIFHLLAMGTIALTKKS